MFYGLFYSPRKEVVHYESRDTYIRVGQTVIALRTLQRAVQSRKSRPSGRHLNAAKAFV